MLKLREIENRKIVCPFSCADREDARASSCDTVRWSLTGLPTTAS